MAKKDIAVLITIPLIVILIFTIYFFFVHKFDVVIASDNEILEIQTIKYNECAKEPKAPNKTNYEFKGWYVGDTKYEFDKPINKNIRIEAKYRPLVSKISIVPNDVILNNNETFKLDLIVEPKGAVADKIIWTSSDESIVTVNEEGLISTISSGSAYISASASNGKSSTIEVRVNEVPADSISIKDKNISISVGEEKTLSVEVLPINIKNNNLKWNVEKNNILSIDKNGTIKGLKAGTSKVTVTTSNGKKDSVTVEVKNVYPTSVNLSNKTITLGKVEKLKVSFTPSNTSIKDVTWKSSDTSIATIDKSGNIVGLKPGKVVITATTSNNKTSSAIITFVSKTKNKTALFVGDSITYGASSTPKGYSWANYIGDNYDLKSATNAGVSGATVSITQKQHLEAKMNTYKKNNYDYIILSGGTNDVALSVALGKYEENDFSGKYNAKSFLGGLESYIYNAKKNWPNAKIGYVITYQTPHSSKNRINLSSKYFNEMKKVLKKWNIDYIDLYSGSDIYGKKYSNLLRVNTYKYLVDGLHLNNGGYNLVSPRIYLWMNTL